MGIWYNIAEACISQAFRRLKVLIMINGAHNLTYSQIEFVGLRKYMIDIKHLGLRIMPQHQQHGNEVCIPTAEGRCMKGGNGPKQSPV
jgi:hypothetical protein